ncbi:hypothetical protein JX266_012342 [Neoarthrinium moseri]|nr:hypothetical protein JX266_012342 [Neoarthrinium moseri]
MGSQAAALPPMSFGIEFEFLMFGKDLKPGATLEAFQRNHPGIIPMPADEDVIDSSRQCVIDYLRSNGVQINDFTESDAATPPSAPLGGHLPAIPGHVVRVPQVEYRRWTLKLDATVNLSTEDNIGRKYEKYTALGFELTSPAFLDQPASHAEIRRVVGLLHHFHVHLNENCSTHVHVGTGTTRMSFEPLHRIALLLWHVDCLLSPLHPEYRQDSIWCRRTRWYSYLARGMTAEQADDATIEVTLSKLPLTLDAGRAALLLAETIWALGRLMASSEKHNAAYEFRNYESAYMAADTKPTLEFRQAGGTMDGDWAVHWARICVRLCEWGAREMQDDELEVLARQCEEVEAGKKDSSSVLFGFLAYLGLDAEVNFLRNTTPDTRNGIANVVALDP